MQNISNSAEIADFLKKIAGFEGADNGRLNKIVHKIVTDLFATIEMFDVNEDEFWHALNFIGASAPEFGLWAAGLGFEHFLDVLMDAKDKAAGVPHGTPRTIEGPLYVAGAPMIEAGGRIDDGTDVGETLLMHGQVRDTAGQPIVGAIVDVWHANTKGNYSHFDKTQSEYNMRRRIKTDAKGAYAFKSIVPSGYAVPPGSGIDVLLKSLGRHGNRPAHIHFFVTAPGFRQLTTQINIDGDPYLHDDCAYATREELVAVAMRHAEPAEIHAAGLNAPYSEITFDFTLAPADSADDEQFSTRARALAA